LLSQTRKVVVDRPPDGLVVHLAIAVDQRIPHADRPLKIRNKRRNLRSLARQTIERLTDNLELPLDRRAHHCVGEVIRETAVPHEIGDPLSGLLDIPQPGTRIMLHREGAANARSRPG
jgi:hypothetical protein